jgi:hypothetical protein
MKQQLGRISFWVTAVHQEGTRQKTTLPDSDFPPKAEAESLANSSIWNASLGWLLVISIQGNLFSKAVCKQYEEGLPWFTLAAGRLHGPQD